MTIQIFAAIVMLAGLGCGDTRSQVADEKLRAERPVTGNASVGVRRSREADQAYEHARQLMERHCGDCNMRSAAGVMEVINKAQRAVALGRNDADVHRLLRDAYSGLAHIDYGDLGHETQSRHYERLMNDEIRIIANLDPSDLENRMRYVELFETATDKIAEIRKVIGEQPKYAWARYRMARLLLDAGEIEEAAIHTQRWLDLANPKELYSYSSGLFESSDEEKLRPLLTINPGLHPATFEIAKRSLGERRDIGNGMKLARASLDKAPPIVAKDYLSELTAILKDSGKRDEAAALRNEYGAKAKSGEAIRRQYF